MLDKTRSWEASVRMYTLGESQEKECLLISPQMEENGSADVGRKIVNKMLMTLNWAIYDGEVPNMRHSARFWDGEQLHGGGTGARGA